MKMFDNWCRALVIAECLFLQTLPAQADLTPDTDVLLADSRVTPGAIYRVAERPFHFPVREYERGTGGIRSIAVARGGGWIYFVDGSSSAIIRTNGRSERVAYRHTTYVRDLAFDSDGRLYFSEATGAGGDGVIFRLNVDFEAEEFVKVPLEEVDGYWAGNFAFDPDDRLYISSGNRVPAAIYAYTEGSFERRYPFNEPITGFVFQNARKILFTNHRQRLYALEGFSVRSVELEHDRFEWLSDVALVPDPPASGPCSISGRLVGGEELWSITTVTIRGPDLFWRSMEGTDVGDDGAYRVTGLPQGHYWISTDIRADVGRGFEPEQEEVECEGNLTGVNFTFG